MPETDGFQATAALRAFEQLHGGHVPVIALTAHALSGDREQCLSSGMDGYLAEPYSLEESDRDSGGSDADQRFLISRMSVRSWSCFNCTSPLRLTTSRSN